MQGLHSVHRMSPSSWNSRFVYITESGPVRKNYGPVRENYGPVRKNYDPVRENYGPVRKNYGPVCKNYGPVCKNHEMWHFAYKNTNDEAIFDLWQKK